MKLIKILALLFILKGASCLAQEHQCHMYWINEQKTQYIQYLKTGRFILWDTTTAHETELLPDCDKVKWLTSTKEFKKHYPEYQNTVKLKD